MAAPSSNIDIVNLALHYLGERKANSIDNPTTQVEEAFALQYDQKRKECLRENVWNFAQRYVEIARSGDGDCDYTDKYTLPSDWVRLNNVGADRYDPIDDYELIDGEIHVDYDGDPLPIWYNIDEDDVTKMDPLFINIFAIRLAMATGYLVTKKAGVVKGLSDLLAIELPKAVGTDGQERPPRRRQQSKYLAARRSGGSLSRDPRYYDVE